MKSIRRWAVIFDTKLYPNAGEPLLHGYDGCPFIFKSRDAARTYGQRVGGKPVRVEIRVYLKGEGK